MGDFMGGNIFSSPEEQESFGAWGGPLISMIPQFLQLLQKGRKSEKGNGSLTFEQLLALVKRMQGGGFEKR